MDEWSMKPIGYVRSPLFGCPEKYRRGSARNTPRRERSKSSLNSRPGLLDIEGFSHLLVIWVFHRVEGFELVGTPPSDTHPHGIFATRAPWRPNPIGLSVVELLGREGRTLRIRGVDMLDGTPVLDVKPYTSSVPAEQLRRGWLQEAEERQARQ